MTYARLPGLILATLLLPLSACNSHSAPSHAPSTQSLHDAVNYLASDDLEGRGIDTPGIDKAADYIARRFQSAGLSAPAGMNDHFQTFDHSSATGIDPSTTLKINDTVYKSGRVPFTIPTLPLKADFTAASFSAEGSFSAPIVFAGYGITNPDDHYDDYANLDAKGKVVLVLRYEPHDEKGKSRFSKSGWSKYAALLNKAKTAADHGAVALILVNPPQFHGQDALLPFASQYDGGSSPIPYLQITRTVADDILKRGGSDLDLLALQKKIDATPSPHSFALRDAIANGTVKIQRTTRQIKNVLAILPGSGPHADEFIVVGAHYDHLGHGGHGSLAPTTQAIHNGADDNASGTASLLELADVLAKGPPPARTILFVAFTAEEEGLIGSAHFVAHPPIPLEKIVAMLNLDMVGRVRNEMLYVGGKGTAAPLKAIVERADEASPLQLKNFGEGGVGPSDHASFAMKKIPVLFLFSGLHADYHRPTDDADKINYTGLSEVVSLAADLTLQLAEMPKSPYVASADHSMSSLTGSPGGSRVQLGVMPDYSTDQSTTGVRITGTVPDSPANKAGLQEGDIITSFGDKKIQNLYDLTDALSAAKAGDKVKLKVLRDAKEITLEATLTERKR